MEKTSILILNDDCLLHLFEILEFDDCMSLAETCIRLANISRTTFQTSTEFTFNSEFNNANEYIDRILYHIGDNLTSLTLWGFRKADYVFSKINQNHSKLKNLICIQLPDNAFRNAASIRGFQHFEALKLTGCSLKNDEDFFRQFSNLTSLFMRNCYEIHKNAFKKYSISIQKISSLCYDDLEVQILPFLINLEKCSLSGQIIGDPSRKINLNRLKCLKLCGRYLESANDLLFKLAREGILEELEFSGYIIDNDTFVALKSFEKLQLLSLTMSEHNVKWNPSFTLPPNLKHLSLDEFVISTIQIASLIKELVSIENLQLRDCKILNRSGSRVLDLKEKSLQISNGLSFSDDQKTINVYFSCFVVTGEYHSKEIFNAGPIRYFCDDEYLDNPGVFNINFRCDI